MAGDGDKLAGFFLVLLIDVELGVGAAGLGVSDVGLGGSGIVSDRLNHLVSAEGCDAQHDEAEGEAVYERDFYEHWFIV